MRPVRRSFATVALALLVTAVAPSFAADQAATPPQRTPATRQRRHTARLLCAYSPQGADTCLGCHDDPGVIGIFRTKHARPDDPRGPFGHGGLQCEACHGPGEHTWKRAAARWRGSSTSAPKRMRRQRSKKRIVSVCHQSNAAHDWASSAHAASDVACASCHQLHAAKDPVRTAATQIEVCSTCHQAQHADLLKPSHHPLREGKMACTACHSPHGSTAPTQLVKNTVNETCTSCHAEYRGPFLWEHQPVTEDCSNCHNAHGSVQPALLKLRPPFLCQTCHEGAGHPSIVNTPQGLPGGGMPQRISARRRLHQLSLADARLEPSVGPGVHAVGAHHEIPFFNPIVHGWLSAPTAPRHSRFAATAPADPPSADTSDWKCTQCPFLQGYTAEAKSAAPGASGANATFGRYTGIDHERCLCGCLGVRRLSQAQTAPMRTTSSSTSGSPRGRAMSRAAAKARYDLRVSYDGQPNAALRHRSHPVQSRWLESRATGPLDPGGQHRPHDRCSTESRTRRYRVQSAAPSRCSLAISRVPAGPLFGEFRHQEHDGTGLTSASFLTEAVQLPQPFDYVTNSFEAGAAVGTGRKASFRFSYLGSWFDDNYDSITFANPYLPIVPGSTQGQLATPPGNTLQQITRHRQRAAALVHDADVRRIVRHAEAKCRFPAGQHSARRRRTGAGLARRRCASVPLCAWTGLAAAAEAQPPR